MADQPTEREERIARAICRFDYGVEDVRPRNTSLCRKDGGECVVGSPCIWWRVRLEQAQGAIQEFEKCQS